ncbi:TPA: radical SAM protein [Bacillus mobilis]|uniref:Radical SAM protein n=1 Tax=Bacillus cereus TaxID=1396 RepID=A0A1Q4LCE0_BACCE|nr:radical SAM protein [Bacillus cereus]HDR7514664.1 radical SAM protein [Bacillus mobilis]OKA38674.1 radical SAM protein [Bacillus cereus]HDR7548254.1 radical SAM protein [Bacillus mobilis]HDR7553484.1 radical SAM protein [Bacillus mobilis]
MKLSKYNIVERMGDNTVIYNTLSSGVLLLNEEYSKHFFGIDKSGVCNKKDLLEELKKGQMVCDYNVDELENLRVANMASRFNNSILSLTLAPSLKCNFACPYCFEDGYRYNTMDKRTQEKFLEFFQSAISNVSTVSVCWYGGEPLLQLKTIEYLTKEMLAKLENTGKEYYSHIITNGFNLTKKVALKLKNLKVDQAQITIDGPPDIHDKRRILLNGQGSFHRIMENIKEAHSILNISIRINVDKTNIHRVDEILDYIESYGLKNKVSFYLAAVDDSASSCKNLDCLGTFDFSNEEFSFYERALKRGFNSIYIPAPNIGICGAVSINSYVIDPKGDFYKCWNEVGREEVKVGDIFNGMKFDKNLTDYLSYNPTENEKCRECSVFPVCFGGCPYISLKTGDNKCDSIKYNAPKLIRLLKKIKEPARV